MVVCSECAKKIFTQYFTNCPLCNKQMTSPMQMCQTCADVKMVCPICKKNVEK